MGTYMKRYGMGWLTCLAVLCLACSKSDAISDEKEGEEPGKEVVLASVSSPTFTSITTNTALVQAQVTNKGGALVTNRGICWGEVPKPTVEDKYMEANTVKGDGTFSVQLTGLKSNTSYYVRAYVRNKGGVAYGEEQTLKTTSIQSVTFANGPMFIIGSTLASYDAEITGNGGGQITERGICWGTVENPTIDQGKVVHGAVGQGAYRCNITGLNERTTYHLRSYAINEQGVSYGANVTFKTIGKGKVTYTFNKETNPTTEQQAAYARLQVAIDSAVWYANNYTSATKHVWINYVPGVPTADANNEGWMRFGTEAGFQNLRTMLHEMNHTFGTGTTSWWRDQAIVSGKYQFNGVNNLLKLITKNKEQTLNGDTQHWWPYGLNQNSEVTSSWDYVYNCLIIEAMRKDGMTSHSGSYIN